MNQWDKIAEKASVKADKIIRATIIQMTNNIVRMSPVKEGRFVNNWFSSIGEASTKTTKRKSTGQKGSARMAEASRTANKLEVGNVFHFTNNLPYAIPLEYGHSGQAPAGMVRVTVAQFKHIVEVSAT